MIRINVSCHQTSEVAFFLKTENKCLSQEYAIHRRTFIQSHMHTWTGTFVSYSCGLRIRQIESEVLDIQDTLIDSKECIVVGLQISSSLLSFSGFKCGGWFVERCFLRGPGGWCSHPNIDLAQSTRCRLFPLNRNEAEFLTDPFKSQMSEMKWEKLRKEKRREACVLLQTATRGRRRCFGGRCSQIIHL